MISITKAVLVSALVYPGAGLWALGQRARAAVFAVPATVAVFYLLSGISRIAHQIAEKIVNGGMGFDLARINAEVHQAIAQARDLDTALWVFVAAWILGIASTYSVGKLRDQQQAQQQPKQQPPQEP